MPLGKNSTNVGPAGGRPWLVVAARDDLAFSLPSRKAARILRPTMPTPVIHVKASLIPTNCSRSATKLVVVFLASIVLQLSWWARALESLSSLVLSRKER